MKIFFILFFILFSLSLKAENSQQIDLNNLNQIIDEKQGGLYQNPFYEDKSFILIFKEEDQNTLSELGENYKSILQTAYFYSSIEGILVSHIINSEKNIHFNTLNFFTLSQSGVFIRNILRNEPINDYYPYIIFLHELFHLHHENQYDYYKEEIMADLFAVLVISKQHNLTQIESENLFNNFFYLRENFLDNRFKENSAEALFINLKNNIYQNYHQIIQQDNFKDIFINLISYDHS